MPETGEGGSRIRSATNTYRTMIYQFTVHNSLPANSAMPLNPVFALYRKSKSGAKLTREEKDTIAECLYGVFGAQGSTYRAGGFAAPFHDHLPRFIVQDRYKSGAWRTYYAPDVTSLRRALRTREEIIQA